MKRPGPILLGVILTTATLIAGSSLNIDGKDIFDPTERLDTGPQEPDYEYSKLESLLRKARDFAQEVIAGCDEVGGGEEGGASSVLSDDLDLDHIMDKLNEMVDGNDFCVESTKSKSGKRDDWSMVVNPYPNFDGTTSEGSRVKNNHLDGSEPSININLKGLKGHLSDNTMCSPTVGDIANVAGVMIHEATHALNGHTGTDAEERAAYETQAKFLCCAIEAIKANPEISGEAESDAIDQICGDLKTSQEKYCSKYGGTGPLFDAVECGCPEDSGSPWPPIEEHENGDVAEVVNNFETPIGFN